MRKSILTPELESKVTRAVDDLKGELVKLTQRLTKIQSLSGEEEEVQSFVKSQLLEIGFSVKSFAKDPRRPNLIANLQGNREHPCILYIAHVDNIPPGETSSWSVPPYEARIVGERIVGRGVADMKAGLAAMIIAAKAIKDSQVPMEGTFSIAAVVDEEVESKYGMRYLAENRLIKADAAIFGEPSFPYIDIALKGGVWLKLKVLGKSVGSGWPQNGINSVTKMAKILLELEKIDLGNRTHPFLGRPTISPGTTIRGGTMIHSIPELCEATVDIYTVPGQTKDEIISLVRNCVERLQREDPELKVEIETIFEAEPYEIDLQEKVLQDLQSSIEAVFGRKAELRGVPSVGDARFLGKLGIPAIPAFGPGEKGKGHVADESVSIETLVQVTKVYALLALRTWSV